MEIYNKMFTAFLKGLTDSVKGCLSIYSINQKIKERNEKIELKILEYNKQRGITKPVRNPNKQEEDIFKRIMHCCVLNGGIFCSSLLIFTYFLMPSIEFYLFKMFGHWGSVWSWTDYTLHLLYHVLWVLPLFLLTKTVNSLWFQDIADIVFKHTRGKPKALKSIGMIITDMAFTLLIEACFLFEMFLFSQIPIIGYVLYMIHACILYSLYSFEYRMVSMGWELHRRLNFVETNWPYFIGFGLPLMLLTNISSSLAISGCIFAMVFPLFIISANEASPVIGSSPRNIKFFKPVIHVSNFFLNKTLSAVNKYKMDINQAQTPANSPSSSSPASVETRRTVSRS